MGELKNEENEDVNLTTFPPKRKPDEPDALTHSDSKKPKPEALLDSKLIENQDQDTEDDDEEEEEYEDTEDEDDEDDDDEEDDEHSNGEAKVDVKGKGIMRDDKGKGKLIEESEQDDDDDDDDSSDDDAINGSDDDSDSDLSDDPLAEVNLDNILPSRTRSRRAASRGVVIGNNDHKDNGDDE